MIELAVAASIYLLPQVWEGGCTVTYRIDSTASEYRKAIPWSTGQITAVTGITFNPSTGPADITFIQHPKRAIPYPGVHNVIGLWQHETGTVWLTSVAPNTRRPIAIHEIMHALGAAHSPGIDTVMNSEGYGRTAFQQDDLDTLNYIAILNGCDPNE